MILSAFVLVTWNHREGAHYALIIVYVNIWGRTPTLTASVSDLSGAEGKTSVSTAESRWVPKVPPG